MPKSTLSSASQEGRSPLGGHLLHQRNPYPSFTMSSSMRGPPDGRRRLAISHSQNGCFRSNGTAAGTTGMDYTMLVDILDQALAIAHDFGSLPSHVVVRPPPPPPSTVNSHRASSSAEQSTSNSALSTDLPESDLDTSRRTN